MSVLVLILLKLFSDIKTEYYVVKVKFSYNFLSNFKA